MTAAYDQLERDASRVPQLERKIHDLYATIAELKAQRAELLTAVGRVKALVDGEPEVTRWIDGQRLIDRNKVAAAIGVTE
jgi:hypothetical protein